jgi:hypothetical protein
LTSTADPYRVARELQVDEPNGPKATTASSRWGLRPDQSCARRAERNARVPGDPRAHDRRDQRSGTNGTNAFAVAPHELARVVLSFAGYGGGVIARNGDVSSVSQWDLEDGACVDQKILQRMTRARTPSCCAD